MTLSSKEIIKKVIEFDSPPRIGFDFNGSAPKDIAWILAAKLTNERYKEQFNWGYYKDILKLLPGFNGEVQRDSFGNIYGRLEEKTKGECIKGVLQDGWNQLNEFQMPIYDLGYEQQLKIKLKENEGKFLLGAMPVGVFSTIRDIRRLDNMLMDLLLDKQNIVSFLKRIEEFSIQMIKNMGELGFDGVIFYDDWGDQKSLLISPNLWREIFKPIYRNIANVVHRSGMKFFIHSCGYIYEIIEDFIEIGVDVLQIDQPELMGLERLGRDFGGRITFWSPVDIQKTMPTGNKEMIQKEAKKMIDILGRHQGGFIAKDYPTWEDIDIKPEWAKWARQVFVDNGRY